MKRSNNKSDVQNNEMLSSNKQKKKFLILVLLMILIVGLVCCATLCFKSVKKSDNDQITIPIAMAADDNYTYPTVVAMTSIMENAADNTSYIFYLMHPREFKNESKDIILSVQNKYEKCNIELINMEDRFSKANSKGHITTPTYYRLSLSSLLPDLDKIIWLDGDTITTGDLRKMYNLDMKKLYYRGFLDNNVDGAAAFGVDTDHYICAGVMLINLQLLREDNIEAKFKDFIEENNERLVQHDQTVVNVVCAGHIGKLPPKYGMFNTTDINWYYNVLKPSSRYDQKELLDACKDPVVLHYAYAKPWKDKNCAFFNTWWEYAEKTPFYEKIVDKYKNTLK